MRRLSAVLLGVLWLVILAAVDFAFLSRPQSLDVLARRGLDLAFASPVDFDRISAHWTGEIRVHNLFVGRPESESQELARIGELCVSIDWGALLAGRLPIRTVLAKDPHLTLVWTPQHGLDLPSPFRSSGSGTPLDRLPKIRLEGLSLHLVNSPYLAQNDVRLVFDELELDLVPDSSAADRRYDFRARVQDDTVGDIDARGYFADNDYDIQFSRRGFHLTEGMRRLLDPEVADLLGRFELGGGVEVLGDLRRVRGSDRTEFTARADLQSAQVKLAGWPQQLTDIAGRVRYEQGRVFCDGPLTAMFEGAKMELKGSVDLTGPHLEVAIDGTLNDLQITDDFVARIAALPDPGPEICEQMTQWRVRGPADITFHFGPRPGLPSRDEFSLAPQIAVELKECSLAYVGPKNTVTGEREGFNYPLTGLVGTIDLTDEGLKFDRLFAEQGPLRLRASGSVNYARAGEEFYKAHVTATNVPIDALLLQALDPGTRRGVEFLNASGMVDVTVHVDRPQGATFDPNPEVDVVLQDVSLKPRSFPLRLEGTRGTVRARGDMVVIETLRARHGTTFFSLGGEVGTESKEGLISLDVTARELKLDREILDAVAALSPEVGAAIHDLHPEGVVDFGVHLKGVPGQATPFVEGEIKLRSVSIAPAEPAIKITEVNGSVEFSSTAYRDRVRLVEGLSGRIAGERFNIQGYLAPKSRYRIDIEADELSLDDELLTALEGVVPALKDRTTRPEIRAEGRDLKVRVESQGSGAVVRGDLRVVDGWLRPASWKTTHLEKLGCTVALRPGGVELLDLAAVLARPKNLPELPESVGSGSPASYGRAQGVEIHVRSCTIRPDGEAQGLALSDLVLTNVPLEPWTLDVLGLSAEDQLRVWPDHLVGSASLSVSSATIREREVILNNGIIQLRNFHLGAHDELYLEEGRLERIYLAIKPQGDAAFEGEIAGTNFRLLGVPVPRFEARLAGDHHGFAMTDAGGALIGYEQDGFDPKTADMEQLRARAENRNYLPKDELRELTVLELRALVEERESFKPETADRDALIAYAKESGICTKRRAQGHETHDLRKLIKDARHERALGVLASERSRFAYSWDTGRFGLEVGLDQVNVASAIRTLGSGAGDVRGRLGATVVLSGVLDDPSSYVGTGSVSANAYNVIQLPFFLNVIKTLDIFSNFSTPRRTRINLEFSIKDRVLSLDRGAIASANISFELVPPGSITFGGIVDARMDVDHAPALSIPLIGDLMRLPADLLFGGIEIQGPLEDPTVTPRSLGFGRADATSSGGRRPVIKDPKD